MFPRHVSINSAAALSGRSPKAIRRLIDDGVLAAERTAYWTRIPFASVEQLVGQKITAEDYMRAQSSLEGQRRTWAVYSAKKRAENVGRVVSA